jgi:hypothetical protein
LFFSANDGVTGVEEWKASVHIDPPEPEPTPTPAPTPTAPSNQFNPPNKGKNNLKKGTLTLQIDLPGAGVLACKQAGLEPPAARRAGQGPEDGQAEVHP